jgi:hypothetical protein
VGDTLHEAKRLEGELSNHDSLKQLVLMLMSYCIRARNEAHKTHHKDSDQQSSGHFGFAKVLVVLLQL